jgi:hypothetical protein
MESYKDICRYVCRSFHKYFVQLTLCTTNQQETAKFKGQFFADPTRKLYHALGMDIENIKRTPKGQPKPSYISLGLIGGILQSVWVNIPCLEYDI